MFTENHYLTLFIPGGDRFAQQLLFLRLSQKFFPATYDKTLCKFLLYTYEDSHNLFWSKKLLRGHVEDINVAWVENCKNNNFKFPFIEMSFLYLFFCLRPFFDQIKVQESSEI